MDEIHSNPEFIKNQIKKIKKRMTISITLTIIFLILLIIAFISPWWAAQFEYRSDKPYGIQPKDRDLNFNYHLTETVIEDYNEQGANYHIPHEKSNEIKDEVKNYEYLDHLKIIFFLTVALIIVTIISLVFLFRLYFTFKSYWVVLILCASIVVLSIISILLFSYYTINDNNLDNLWGDTSIKLGYDNYQMSYQTAIGFYVMIAAVILLFITLAFLFSIVYNRTRRKIIKVYRFKPNEINKTHIAGIILFIITFLILLSTLTMPWWICRYLGEIEHPPEATAFDFGWGPNKAYFIVEQENLDIISPFDGYMYTEKSVNSEEFFIGDYEERQGITYIREKEVVSNTSYLMYLAIGMILFTIIASIYILLKKIHIKWITMISFLSAIIIIIPLIYFSTALPWAYQEDMREPYIEGEYPIPSYSQAEVIHGFSGEWEQDVPYAPWVDEYRAQPEAYDSNIKDTINVHYEWGPSPGYFVCILALILSLLGTILFSISGRKRIHFMDQVIPEYRDNSKTQQGPQQRPIIRKNILLVVITISLSIIILSIPFSPMLYNYSSAESRSSITMNDGILTGSYKRVTPITSNIGRDFVDNWYCGREFVLNLDNGEKFMIPNYENKSASANHFNGNVVVWHSEYFKNVYDSNSILVYNLSTKNIDIIKMNFSFNIKGISKSWLLLETYYNNNQTYFLRYFDTGELIAIPIDAYDTIPCPNNNYIIYETNWYEPLHIYDIKKNETKDISPPKENYRIDTIWTHENKIIFNWYDSSTSDSKNIFMFFDTKENDLYYEMSGYNRWCSILYKNGFVTFNETRLLYYDLEKMEQTEWSIPLIFVKKYFFFSIFHSYDNKIYFGVSEFKMEDLLYHFNSHVTGKLYVFHSGYPILWELDLEADSDYDGESDIYDNDDDNDGVTDYEDAYPYDSTKSEIIHKKPKYKYVPPAELQALIIVIIIVGVAVIWRLKSFEYQKI